MTAAMRLKFTSRPPPARRGNACDRHYWVCICADPLPAPPGRLDEECGRCGRPNYLPSTIARLADKGLIPHGYHTR